MLASLLLGTSSGVWRVGGQQAALHGQLITHLACSGSGAAAAAVPTPGTGNLPLVGARHGPQPAPPLVWHPKTSHHHPAGPVHGMYELEPAAPQDSGLHLLRHSAADGFTAERVWAGDARSCCIWDLSPGGQEQGRPTNGGAAEGSAASGSRVGLAVGTEPADVFVSLDGGGSWSPGTSTFQGAPSRSSWSFPAPPHEPHVLSLERTASGQLVAGIEVGGVLVGGGGPDRTHFEEHNEGLYADVHSCRIDPHNPQHWLAVTGELEGAARLWRGDCAGCAGTLHPACWLQQKPAPRPG